MVRRRAYHAVSNHGYGFGFAAILRDAWFHSQWLGAPVATQDEVGVAKYSQALPRGRTEYEANQTHFISL
jgi:hypothetical protein